MAETNLSVKLIAHSRLSDGFKQQLKREIDFSDGQAITLSAVRTCYSANKPSQIVNKEGEKYFGNRATDGKGGTEADRLFRHIMSSKHTSVNEHVSFTFAIEGVSRALLAQLTRHRVGFSFSVQSQRYVRFGSGDRSGGMDYVMPDTASSDKAEPPGDIGSSDARELFEFAMEYSQDIYDRLRACGVPAEDARAVLPNAAATNLVMTANLTALLGFYRKRKPGNGAQAEIARLAEELKDAVVAVEPWTKPFFEQGGEA
ncbi:FAD-dependent thymidylate synthase [Diaphorobacter sp. DS2]|nr:FAD-dependent thymidylate synthase [Diaphorobacter sp. DS2]